MKTGTYKTLEIIIKTRRKWLISSCVLSLAGAFLSVWIWTVVGELLNSLGDRSQILFSLALCLVSFSFLILVRSVTPYLFTKYLTILRRNLYHAVGEQLMKMDLAVSVSSGEANAYLGDVESICQALHRLLQKAIGDAGLFLFGAVVLFRLHWSLPLIGILCSLLPVLVLRLTHYPIKKAQESYRKEEEKVNESLAFGLDNLESLKAFRLEEKAAKQAEKSLDRLQTAEKKSARLGSILLAPSLFSAFATMFALSVWGGRLTASGTISVGQLFTVLGLTDYLVSPVMGLENTIRIVVQARTAARKLDCFFAKRREQDCQDVREPLHGKEEDSIPEIRFNHVDFSYGNRIILKDFCADWKAGHCHYIMGPAGSGKTTLMKLVTAMLRPNAGRVLVCGRSTDCWNKGELRRRISVMPQELILFADTILENVRLYREEYTAREVEKALDEAGLSDKIRQLPGGIHTQLSENGGPLSQGEKQRLVFARCLLRKTDIYILDEPTAFLDSAKKEQLIKKIRALAARHLVLVITHDRDCVEPGNEVTELTGEG